MKKVLLAFLLVFISVSLFAVNINLHAGYLSGIGISSEASTISYGISAETSFPVYATVNGFSGMNYNDLSFKEGFVMGAKQIIGGSAFIAKAITKSKIGNLSLGAELLCTTDTYINNTDIKLKAFIMYQLNKTGLFLKAGFPVIRMTRIDGFKNTLITFFDTSIPTLFQIPSFGVSIKL